MAATARLTRHEAESTGDHESGSGFCSKTSRRIAPFHPEAPHQSDGTRHIGKDVQAEFQNAETPCQHAFDNRSRPSNQAPGNREI
jgi:hypothetical protein